MTNRPLAPTDVGPAYLRFGGIAGTVTDATTRTPLAGASVLVSRAPAATTDALGRYAVANLPVGGYTVTASKSAYVTSPGTSVTVTGGTTTTANIALTPTPLVSGPWLAPSGGAAVTVGSGDNDGYESGAASLLVTDGVLARDVNSGTGSGTTCTSTTRDRHELVGFVSGLSPSTPVRGIEVALRGRADAKTGSPQFCVRLSSDGGLTWTAGRTTPGLSTSLTTYTLGTTTDVWGRLWAGADLGAGFRVQVVDLSTSMARTFSLDSVKVRITT
ncbi:MAG: carboxypeptidase regulatory-like domain-containing protein [Actinomycetes bacterium]